MTWDEINNVNSGLNLPTPTPEEFLVAKIFKSDEGQKALTYLKNLAYEKKPIALQNDGINTTIVMAMQEGEINFFRKIEKILTKIENYDRRK